ncbi:MAG: restriction endonuclease subunit S [Desulfosporosinus sp.]|nr:restriction endonuclease subunit S [Desulfosporosinus sp.]
MSENKGNVPKIRFPEFTDAWEQRKLGELYTERKEPGYDSLQILSVSIHHGISNQELDSNTLGKKVRRSEDKSLYKHVNFGDLVLNMMRAWQGAIGVVKSEGMVSPAYITAIPSAELYPLFMDYYLRRDEAIIQMNNLSYGVTDFRKRLYWDSFIIILCSIPSVPEQERITAFFTQLDNYIILHQRKLNNVKKLKAGLLQKMFPKDGEAFPEVRFPGFTDDWEQREFGELAKIRRGLTYSPANVRKEGVRVLRSSNIDEDTFVLKEDDVFVEPQAINIDFVKENDILITSANGSSRLVGKHALIKKNCNRAVHGGFMLLATADEPEFINALMSSPWYDRFIGVYVAGGNGAIGNLNKNDLETQSVYVPEASEQRKVGAFFADLDHLITLHQRKLKHLQEQKKALLQQMFV